LFSTAADSTLTSWSSTFESVVTKPLRRIFVDIPIFSNAASTSIACLLFFSSSRRQ